MDWDSVNPCGVKYVAYPQGFWGSVPRIIQVGGQKHWADERLISGQLGHSVPVAFLGWVVVGMRSIDVKFVQGSRQPLNKQRHFVRFGIFCGWRSRKYSKPAENRTKTDQHVNGVKWDILGRRDRH